MGTTETTTRGDGVTETAQLSLLDPPDEPEPEDDPWEDGDPIPYNEFPPGY